MTLPADLHSPDQLSELVMELRSYIDALRDTAVKNRSGASAGLPPMSTLLKQLFENATTTPEDLLRELETMLKHSPVAHVILPAPAGKELRHQLIVWFRTEVHPQTLLTFTERRDIGGGVIVRAGSNIYDFSFKRLIVDNKHRLTEIAGV